MNSSFLFFLSSGQRRRSEKEGKGSPGKRDKTTSQQAS